MRLFAKMVYYKFVLFWIWLNSETRWDLRMNKLKPSLPSLVTLKKYWILIFLDVFWPYSYYQDNQPVRVLESSTIDQKYFVFLFKQIFFLNREDLSFFNSQAVKKNNFSFGVYYPYCKIMYACNNQLYIPRFFSNEIFLPRRLKLEMFRQHAKHWRHYDVNMTSMPIWNQFYQFIKLGNIEIVP